MDLSLLKTLKRKLQTSKSFVEVTEYFFDHFGDDPDFIEIGEATDDPNLVQVLAQVAVQMIGRRVAILENLRLIRISDHQFIHGGFIIQGHIGSVLYFEDLQMGLVSMSLAGESKFARFSAETLRGHPQPSQN